MRQGPVEDAVGVGVVLGFPGHQVSHRVRGCTESLKRAELRNIVVRSGAVEDILHRCGLGEVDVVAPLKVEVVAERLRIHQPSPDAAGAGLLGNTLVHKGAAGRIHGIIGAEKRIGDGLVVASKSVVGDIPVHVEGYCPARDSKPLTKEGPSPGLPVLIGAGVVGVTVICAAD